MGRETAFLSRASAPREGPSRSWWGGTRAPTRSLLPHALPAALPSLGFPLRDAGPVVDRRAGAYGVEFYTSWPYGRVGPSAVRSREGDQDRQFVTTNTPAAAMCAQRPAPGATESE